MRQSSKPNVCSLNSLQIEPFEEIPPQTLAGRTSIDTNMKNKKNYYWRNQIYINLKKRLFQPYRFNYGEIDKITDQYFTNVINPAYSKVQSLPIKFYVCGFCKEVFYKNSEYLSHCLQEQCPINHERSTFFTYSKKTNQKITNYDISKMLSVDQLQLLKTSYVANQDSFFSEYELTPKDKSSNQVKCGKCLNLFIRLPKYINHCVFHCKSRKNKQTSHIIKLKYCEQEFKDFIKDITNFYLNYNILALFQDSYIRISQISKHDGNHKYTCQYCKIIFQNSEDFLLHSLFQCHSNLQSSHIIKRKQIKQFKQKTTIYNINRIKSIQQNEKSVNIMKSSQLSHNKKFIQPLNESFTSKLSVIGDCIQQVNRQYKDMENILKDIYICGQCLQYFQSSKLYWAHCFIFLCPLNHIKSSHFFYSSTDKKMLQTQYFHSRIQEKYYKQILQNYRFFRKSKFNFTYNLINKQNNSLKIQITRKEELICGSCGFIAYRKDYYIYHIMKECQSQTNQKNTHRIVLKQNLKSDKQMREYVKNISLSLQIKRLTPSLRYKLTQNECFIQKLYGLNEKKHICGSCKFLTDNAFEFVYHFLTVCKSTDKTNSSHFIEKIKSRFVLSDPYQVVQQNLVHQNIWKKQLRTKSNLCKINPKQQQKTKINQASESQNSIQDENEDDAGSVSQENIQQNKRIQNNFIEHNIDNDQFDRYLYPVLDYIPQNQSKFHCGKCHQDFKRQQLFVEHISMCSSFQNIKSSHFLISLNRMNEINENIAINHRNLNQGHIKQYPQYRQSDQIATCGCGQKPSEGFACHSQKLHSWQIPKGSSHIVLRCKLFKQHNTIHLYLPIKSRPCHIADQFVCPCNPVKTLSYDLFVNHVIKRHGGKTPIFYMKKNSIAQN